METFKHRLHFLFYISIIIDLKTQTFDNDDGKKSASLLILRPLMVMDKEIKVIRIYLQVEAH